jgi:hypothetical protein
METELQTFAQFVQANKRDKIIPIKDVLILIESANFVVESLQDCYKISRSGSNAFVVRNKEYGDIVVQPIFAGLDAHLTHVNYQFHPKITYIEYEDNTRKRLCDEINNLIFIHYNLTAYIVQIPKYRLVYPLDKDYQHFLNHGDEFEFEFVDVLSHKHEQIFIYIADKTEELRLHYNEHLGIP